MRETFKAAVFLGVSSMLSACRNPDASYLKPIEVQDYIETLEEQANVVFSAQERSQMACFLFSITNGDMRNLEKAMKPIVEVLEKNVDVDSKDMDIENVIRVMSNPVFQQTIKELGVLGANMGRKVSALCLGK